MATIVVLRGRNVFIGRGFDTTQAYAKVQTMAVDDRTTGFADGDSTLNSPSNVFAVAFNATPSLNTGTATATIEATVPTGSGNFTIRRISMHNAAAGSVNGSSSTLVSGVDGQGITKTSDFSILFRKTMQGQDASS